MTVKSYKYILPNADGIVEGLDRKKYMTPQYIGMVKDYINSIELKGKCAFLYVGGVALSASEARNVLNKPDQREPKNESSLAIREITAYSMHKWIGQLKDRDKIKYANISSNTCASSMYSLYEAARLLDEGFDEVIIVAEEKTSYNTLRVFFEHGIDIKIGEGLAIIHLHKGKGIEITNTKWSYEFNSNPFGTTTTGYSEVFTECDIVKPHGTGTSNNEEAEQPLCKEMEQLRYKEQIGHTQGVSGLIEVCMVLDEGVKGKVLCMSAGLGGFYGSCIINK